MSVPFRIMTYNVHSCRGRDGVFSPERIAEVIGFYSPDVVAVQELDIELSRSGTVDQAEAIANHLNMHFHFHPSFSLEEGSFGNAVLSRYPMRLIKAGELPSFRHRRLLEKRGALWVEIQLEGSILNLINTHLGLNRKERHAQVDALLGPEWTGSPFCNTPVLLCGDFNASPFSGVYRKIINRFKDVQKRVNGYRPRGTWPSIFPFLRIDHIFASDILSVRDIEILMTGRIREASDHLPVVAEIELA